MPLPFEVAVFFAHYFPRMYNQNYTVFSLNLIYFFKEKIKLVWFNICNN